MALLREAIAEAAHGWHPLVQPRLPPARPGQWEEAIRVRLESRKNYTHEGAFPGKTHMVLSMTPSAIVVLR